MKTIGFGFFLRQTVSLVLYKANIKYLWKQIAGFLLFEMSGGGGGRGCRRASWDWLARETYKGFPLLMQK